MIWRSGVPMGTSTIPGFFTPPATEKTLVPLLFSVPMAANHSAPLAMITGTLAQVSTLLMIVGWPQRPCLGRIGRPVAGLADIALDKVMSAVSSPQT